MECYEIKSLTFTYPGGEIPALNHISLTINTGEFITLCGQSGCGKSTFLRHLKPALTPHGAKTGEILFGGRPLDSLDHKTQSQSIGFVSQNPDNQIVTDKVWHELAFGLESLGMKTPEIRARVAEMASFFGIQGWFHKNVAELSGGQKQLLNLASIMVMQPDVLLLDEPTGQLDPIAAADFLEAVSKISRELGTTVILSEHRLEEAFAISDRILVMDKGRIVADAPPKQMGGILHTLNHPMFSALPTASRVSMRVESYGSCPVTIREGKDWLGSYAKTHPLSHPIWQASEPSKGPPVLSLKEVYFRYEKNAPDVIKGLSLDIHPGELYAIVGGNGTGKTTALSIMSGLLTPHRGAVFLYGKPLKEIENLYDGIFGVLPQSPQTLFVKKTVKQDLLEILSGKKCSKEDTQKQLGEVVALCRLEGLLERHPYDLSGGEQQRAALAKILLLRPQILLLDEPTKGFDAQFKSSFADILHTLKENGTTIVMVSHDIEFCAAHADRCAMFFDGAIVSEDSPRAFFSGKSFYTTAANRVARDLLPDAILAEDIIHACKGTVPEPSQATVKSPFQAPQGLTKPKNASQTKRLNLPKLLLGCAFGAAFLVTMLFFLDAFQDWRSTLVQGFSLVFLSGCLICLLPQKLLNRNLEEIQTERTKRKLSKRTLLGVLMILLAVPLTIYVGVYFLNDRKYYFISLLILVETMIPFGMVFEDRKPQVRELVLISVLCAIGVASRMAFYMLPQFKPMLALVIIAGVCFGGETGFLVGAVTAFVSNFFFGQGAWTPWQMLALGIVGFAAGILFRKGFLRKTRVPLCVYGGLATLILYGGIMNPATVLMYQENPTLPMFLSAFVMGLPFDLVHAAATVFFLWFAAPPMIEKLDRMKIKYGIL